jgi:hypothetical protein
MAFLDEIKSACKIDGTDSDTEVSSLIAACIIDLTQAGVDPAKLPETDALYKLAVVQYCKSFLYPDDRVTEIFQKSYDGIKVLMSLSSDYRMVTE